MRKVKVNTETAKRWAIGAYTETLSKGRYVAAQLNKIPGGTVFQVVAKRAGLIEKYYSKNRWVDINTPPNDAHAQKLMDLYIEYTGRKSDDEKLPPPAPKEKNADRLARIERKLDRLIQMWDVDSKVDEPFRQGNIT